VPRNLERFGEIVRPQLRSWEPKLSVHGTEVQGVALSAGYAVLRAGNRHVGPLWQGAVATPVFGWLRPPNTLCTPIVASRVATARLTIKF
jgi:hypothetical protein